MKQFRLVISLLSLAILISCNSQKPVLKTVEKVAIKKYLGVWYDIANYPQRFQAGCQCTTAEYALSEKGYVIVTNRCLKGVNQEEIAEAKGKAFIVDAKSNAKLKVQFFWPFSGKYWIIDLAEDYSYAVVGHPNRKYLWILSRIPVMQENVYSDILLRLTKQGYDINKIVKTNQNCTKK